jgi:AcrR family transcriptional regulator
VSAGRDGWLTPRQCDILDVARRVVCVEGVPAVSIDRLARELGVAPSSVSEDFACVDEVLAELAIDAVIDQAVALRNGGRNPLAVAEAYRRFALEHTALYRLIASQGLPRESVDACHRGAARVFIDALGQDVGRVWAFAHGMVELELDGRFSPSADLDAARRAGMGAFAAAAGGTAESREPG